jgi:hypothetical protein
MLVKTVLCLKSYINGLYLHFKREDKMKKCNHCSAILLPGANFCHKCGASTKEETTATETSTTSAENTLFTDVATEEEELYLIENEVISEISTDNFYHIDERNAIELDMNEKKEKIVPTSMTQFKTLFFDALHKRITEEHNPLKYSDYVERFYQKEFNKILASRLELLIEEQKRMNAKGEKASAIDVLQQQIIEKLVNYFVIGECADLNDVPLNEKILQYDEINPKDISLAKMIEDFLQLEEESFKTYKNFITMPPERLETAIKSFASAPREEELFFIADATISNTCKEGFAMSNRAIYWKAPLEKAQRVAFTDLKNAVRHKEWIEINGLFFNFNKSLNMKLLRMLKTIISLNKIEQK